MVDLRLLKSDDVKQEEGVWREYPKGGRFLIARAGNKKAESYKRSLTRPYQGRRKGIPDEVALEIGQKVAARCILLDVGDVVVNEQEFGHSEEDRLMIMQDPELQDIAFWVLTESDSIENYDRESKEDAAKN